jgi:NodT family efflux transporter outer membrane factor (OMF) lipoprotein
MSARRLAPLLAAVALAGCNLAPPYRVPVTPEPPAIYKETGPWTPAAPADATPRGRWWAVIQDPELDSLEDRLESDNPSLAAALARYEESRALATRARAALFPELDAGGYAQDAHYPHLPEPYASGGGSLSYELDLWGRIRNQVAAAKAEAQASAADVAAARLSLQALLAETYLGLRGADAEIDVLRQTQTAYAQALDLTQARYDGGAASEQDVSRARTQLGDVQSQYAQAQASRALLEHAIAALVGASASRFEIAARPVQAAPPEVPVDAPSALLQRRPDIAAAERRVASANAEIGVYRAALYPAITLSAAGGYDSLGTLAATAAGYWAVGPATALLPVFDAGRRRADIRRARAAFDEAAATYRLTVLDAFRQVEDELALANRLAEAEAHQQQAVDAAQETDQLALGRYKEGAADYLEVVTAQAAELDARRADVELRTRRLVASIDLVRALGGGWNAHASASR